MHDPSLQKRILGHLKDSQDDMVQLLKDLTNIDSPSTSKPHLDRFAEFLAGIWRDAGAVGRNIGVQLNESGTGGGSDGNFTSALGVPTLDGLGPVGGDAHSPGEYLLLSSLPERAAVLAGILLAL